VQKQHRDAVSDGLNWCKQQRMLGDIKVLRLPDET